METTARKGFVAAFDQATGKEVWRFSTLPKPGEPAWDTWKGTSIEHGGANAWFTGTYDPDTDTLFWPTGNPGPDYNGDERGGDNLYSDCILALDPASGKLKWYYQFTPHDLWDWDATETPMVINANWEGQRRKLLVQANRNGFFYVFDRTNGKLLLAKQFIKNLTWATGIGPDGKPIKTPNQEPTAEGTHVCPSQDGATNWFSPSYNPSTGLYYIQVFEKCSIYTKRPVEWEQGKAYGGGTQRVDTNPKPQRLLYAVDLQTGNRKWELPQAGTGSSWGGTLATSTGLVFFGDDSGAFAAADAVSGKTLWSFQANANWHASPMAYQFDGQEYIAIAAGDDILAFGLDRVGASHVQADIPVRILFRCRSRADHNRAACPPGCAAIRSATRTTRTGWRVTRSTAHARNTEAVSAGLDRSSQEPGRRRLADDPPHL